MTLEFKIEYRPLQNQFTFLCPSGFKYNVSGLEGVLELLEGLARRGTPLHTSLSETLFLNPSGDITIVQSDDWENSKYTFGTMIASAPALARAATTALREYYGK